MTWSNPVTGSALFDTDDIPTEGNFDTYLFNNLLSLMHPLEAPTTSSLNVVNVTTEETLYSVTVPANTLGTTGSIELEIMGEIKGTAGGAHICTTRVKFGGTTLLTYTADMVNVTSYVPNPIVIKVVNRGTNSQLITAYSRMGAAGATLLNQAGPVGGAVDTTSAQTLLVSVQWATATAANSIFRHWARTLVGQN